MSEWILIEQLRQGNETAFKTIVETWQDMVYNTALGIIQNAEDAEDISQEVFVQVYESINTFKGEAKFSTWLYKITVTKTMDHIRRKKRKKRFAFIQSIFGINDEIVHDPPDFHHPGIVLDKKETAAELFKAIDQLPENQKIAFTLNKLEGLNYQEVSEIMNTTVPSIESLLHRAKNNLKKLLEIYYREKYNTDKF
ncbi:MAG: RNA polymerase sigma factor [Chitinophagaceae bacterium]|nr:RNA polymerase sigma factor [Chitinophagaceae bacterium]